MIRYMIYMYVKHIIMLKPYMEVLDQMNVENDSVFTWFSMKDSCCY